MRDSSTQLEAEQDAGACATLARSLAPEEVRQGDFVAVLQVTYEVPSFMWRADSFQIPHDEPVRIQFMPDGGGLPLKVRSICLPFVFVKDPDGNHRTLDVRKCRLARLHPDYAKVVWKAHKKSRPKALSVLGLL